MTMKPKHLKCGQYEYRGYRIRKVKRGSWSVYEYSEGYHFVLESGLTKAQAVAFIDELQYK